MEHGIWIIFGTLAAGCALLMIIERMGVPTTLELSFKGDIKREGGWVAQYGQGACTVVAALLVWRLDPRGEQRIAPMLVAVFGTSVLAMIVKRLLSRVRPRRENAGKFLGPHFGHANWRESFPSSHSASAVALSVFLAGIYPQGAAVFWGLALLCAVMRYLMDAHWPSDVLGGIALGFIAGHWTLRAFGL